MKKRFVIILYVLAFGLFIAGCKSEFEKVRASGNTDLLYKKTFEYNEQHEYLRAQALFELIIPAYRGKPELEKIYFAYADTYFKLNKFILANYYYKNFSSTFPTSSMREEADFMAAFSNYQMSPIFRLDQTYTEKAIDEFQTFVNTYPNSERVKECNRLIDEMRLKLERKAFEEGKLYFDLKQYHAATVTFENLLKDFPETNNAEQVRYYIAKGNYLLAENSIYEKQEERYKQTSIYSKDYLDKFKSSPNYKEIKSYYDNSIKKLKSFTNGRHQEQNPRVGS